MKKIISIALILVMMMAVCIPAFAANEKIIITDKTSEKTKDIIVVTQATKEDGTSGESYSVKIPAKAEIPWGKESYAVDYDVESHLAYGKRLSVVVTTGNGKMSLNEDATKTLAYTLSGTKFFRASSPVVYNNEQTPAVTQPLQINVTADAWARAIVGEYSGILTFAVEVEENV